MLIYAVEWQEASIVEVWPNLPSVLQSGVSEGKSISVAEDKKDHQFD